MMSVKYPFFCFFLSFGIVLFAQKQWSFQECVQYAQENNINIQSALQNEKILQLQETITKNEKLPQISGSFNNAIDFGFQQLLTGFFEYNQAYSNSLSLDASMLLYNRGNLKIQNEKSKLDTQAQTEAIAQSKLDIEMQLAGLYLQILLNKELLGIAKEQLVNSSNQLDRTEKLYKAGSIPYATLVEQIAKNSNDKSQVQSAKIDVERALFVLANAMQLSDYESFEVESVTLPNDVLLDDLDIEEYIRYALENRPVMKQAELQLQNSEQDIELAKTALWPSITAGYSLGTSYFDSFDRAENGLFDQWYDNHNQRLFVGISIPIFNKHNSKLNIQRAELSRELSVQNIAQQKITLEQEIEAILFDARAAHENYNNLKISYEAAKTSEDYGLKSYEAGRTSVYDYNVLQTNTVVAKSQMVQAKYNLYYHLKRLDSYLGKSIEF